MSFGYFSWAAAAAAMFALGLMTLLFIIGTVKGKKQIVLFYTEARRVKALRVYRQKRIVLGFLLFLALSSFLFSVFQPEWGEEKQERAIFGVDVIFCLDISHSMLAEDTQPSRIGYAKLFMLNTVTRFPENSYGITIFKGDGVLLLPLTQDPLTLRRYISDIHPGLSTVPGTNIEKGLDAAFSGFVRSRPGREYVFLLSDGEELPGNAGIISRKSGTAQVWSFLLGTEEGAPLELSGDEVTVTKADPGMLKKMSDAYNGLFFNLGVKGSIRRFEDTFSKILEKEHQTGYEYIKKRHTPILTLFGVCILFVYLFIRAVPWQKEF